MFVLISRKKNTNLQCFIPAINFRTENHASSRHAFNVARDSYFAKETIISATAEFNLLQIPQLDIQQLAGKYWQKFFWDCDNG